MLDPHHTRFDWVKHLTEHPIVSVLVVVVTLLTGVKLISDAISGGDGVSPYHVSAPTGPVVQEPRTRSADPASAAPTSGPPPSCAELIDSRPSPDAAPEGGARNSRFAFGAHLVGGIEILNVTCGDDRYWPATRGFVDDVLQAQLWYRNLADKPTQSVPNVRFIAEPFDPLSSRVVAIVRIGDEQQRASVRVVRSIENASLRPVPGSVVWRRAVARGEESDRYENALAPGRVGFARSWRLGQIRPGQVGTVTAQFRVQAAVASIRLESRDASSGKWRQELTVAAGTKVPMRVAVTNAGNVALHDLALRVDLDGLGLVKGTETVRDPASPSSPVSARSAFRGSFVNTGPLEIGGTRYLDFEAAVGNVRTTTARRPTATISFNGGDVLRNAATIVVAR